MNVSFKFWGSFLFFLVIQLAVQSQVLVKAVADKDRILIGETIHISLEARLPLGEPAGWKLPDSLAHFEWVEKGKPETIEGVDGKKIVQVVAVTSYDSGYWVIPPIRISVKGKSYVTDTVGIWVVYIPQNATDDYRDIKTIEEVPDTRGLDKKWIILVALTIISLVVIVFLLRKKKAGRSDYGTSYQSPYDEAMQKLEALRKQLPEEAIQMKPFYSSLNDVFRMYLARRSRQLASRQKTNEELILTLKDAGLSQEIIGPLTQTLRMADFVKFARYQPTSEDHIKSIGEIEKAIFTLHRQPI